MSANIIITAILIVVIIVITNGVIIFNSEWVGLQGRKCMKQSREAMSPESGRLDGR